MIVRWQMIYLLFRNNMKAKHESLFCTDKINCPKSKHISLDTKTQFQKFKKKPSGCTIFFLIGT